MTCIVGIISNNKIYMGADSIGIADDFTKRTHIDSKIFIKKDIIVGFAGSFRQGQIIKYHFNPTPIKKDQPVFEYLVINFVEELKQCIKKYANEDLDITLLLGMSNRLFQIHDDGAVEETDNSFSAIGSSEDIAIGSLATSTGDPESRIKKALEVSETFCAGVAKPFRILSL